MTRPGDSAGTVPHPEWPGSIAKPWHYLPRFLSVHQADALLRWLLEEIDWRSESVRIFGRTHPAPRLVAWCGDPGLSYRYSGVDHPASGWPDTLAVLRDRLELTTGTRYNFLLMNRYRDGGDGMGWHRDDEPMSSRYLGSLSLGATRRFLIRPDPGQPSARLDLEHGSLLLMDRFLPHSLPKTRRPTGPRVNLTFRCLPCSI